MLRLGVTGGTGFLGWHIRAFIYPRGIAQVVVASRTEFADVASLRTFVRTNDAIVHLAGMNRGDDAEIESTNVSLTRALIDACEHESVTPHVVFANSTHVDRDTAYGRSKRRSAALLEEWSKRSGARFTDLVLPGVFGEGGRPFYNSVVSTFCHQLVAGEAPTIHENREIELLHAQDAASIIVGCIKDGRVGRIAVKGATTTTRDLLDRLRKMLDLYVRHVVPSVEDSFDLALFNTLRAYLFPRHYPVAIECRADSRGALFEVVKSNHGGGQCFMSMTKPGVTRGNHYHTAKIERFLVAQGEAIIRLRRLFSSHVYEFHVRGDSPVYIDMPTFYTHSITNVGSAELLTLFWANEIFDPAKPDTYREPV